MGPGSTGRPAWGGGSWRGVVQTGAGRHGSVAEVGSAGQPGRPDQVIGRSPSTSGSPRRPAADLPPRCARSPRPPGTAPSPAPGAYAAGRAVRGSVRGPADRGRRPASQRPSRSPTPRGRRRGPAAGPPGRSHVLSTPPCGPPVRREPWPGPDPFPLRAVPLGASGARSSWRRAARSRSARSRSARSRSARFRWLRSVRCRSSCCRLSPRRSPGIRLWPSSLLPIKSRTRSLPLRRLGSPAPPRTRPRRNATTRFHTGDHRPGRVGGACAAHAGSPSPSAVAGAGFWAPGPIGAPAPTPCPSSRCGARFRTTSSQCAGGSPCRRAGADVASAWPARSAADPSVRSQPATLSPRPLPQPGRRSAWPGHFGAPARVVSRSRPSCARSSDSMASSWLMASSGAPCHSCGQACEGSSAAPRPARRSRASRPRRCAG